MQSSFNLSNSATFTEVLPGIFAGNSSGELKSKTSSGDKSSVFRSTQLLHEKVVVIINRCYVL